MQKLKEKRAVGTIVMIRTNCNRFLSFLAHEIKRK